MTNRYKKLGIKQTIQRHWMDRVVKMMLAGMNEKQIRADLDDYLSTQKQSGGTGERGMKTYGMAVAALASWFSPDETLIPFRDDALSMAQSTKQQDWLPLHWAVISASYPFWMNVAKQAGRVLNLQDQITQPQLFNRLKEQYGDRETVSRNSRYTLRSFVAWEVLDVVGKKGCYMKAAPITITNTVAAALLIESVLLTIPEGKGEIGSLLNYPGNFPFTLPGLTADSIARVNKRLEVSRYGLETEFLFLK